MDLAGYSPSLEEQRTKAKFWVRARKQGVERDEVTLATGLSLTGDARLTTWWGKPGFSTWFANDTEFEEEMEYLVYRMPFYLLSVLEDDSEKSSGAKVNALKLLAEIANKMPVRHKQVVWKDASIQNMSPDQLRRFIAKESKKLGLAASVPEQALGSTEAPDPDSDSLDS